VRRELAFGFGFAAVTLAIARPALAAAPQIRFHIEPKPYSEALLDVAQQANVTLVGAGACAGEMQIRIAAPMTLSQALDRVLGGADCTWKMVAPGAVQVSPLTHAAPRPTDYVSVSELLVTATKRVSDPRQLSVAVTAVPGDALEMTGASDADAASAQLSGLLTTNLGPGRDKLQLRGLSDGAYTGRARSTVATYLDEIPLNYNAPDPDLRLVDVDRVEVLRGPQGALYGSGSLSGIYRIVAAKPDLQHYAAQLRLTGAVTDGGAPSESTEGYLTGPIWRGLAGLRLSAYQDLEGGYLDDVNLKLRNANQTQRAGGRLSFLVEPGDDWTIDLTFAGQHLRSADTQYTSPGLGLTRVNRIAEPHVNDIVLGTVTIKKGWGWADLTSSTGYIEHAYGSFYDATAVQDVYTSFAETSAYSERVHTQMLVEDTYLTSRGAGPVQWLAGVYGSVTREHSPSVFLAQHTFAPDVEVYGDNRFDRIAELALYGEVSVAITDALRASVGGRAFNIHTDTTSAVVSERFAPRSVLGSEHYSGFSPKAAIQQSFSHGDLLYAVFSEGFRAGGINSGGAVPLPQPLEIYAPDQLRNLEGGVKFQALNGRLAINSALFYDTWKDVQSDQFRASGIPFTTNVGDADILGFETELGYNWGNGFSAQLNGRVAHTRITHPNLAFIPSPLNGLPGAPAGSGGAVVSWEGEIANGWRMRLVGETTYVGRSRVTFDTTFQAMGGYVRSKLLAEVRRNVWGAPWGAQVFITNPTNAFSDTFAFGNPFNPTQTQQVTPQRPLTAGLTLFATY
jgi:outer membrane receptor protein involved in Fe transport